MNTKMDIQSKLLRLDDITAESTETSLNQLRDRIGRDRIGRGQKNRQRILRTMIAVWICALMCPISVMVMRHIEQQEKRIITGEQPPVVITHGIAVDDGYPFEPDARVIAALNIGQYLFLMLAVWLSVRLWKGRPAHSDSSIRDQIANTSKELEQVSSGKRE